MSENFFIVVQVVAVEQVNGEPEVEIKIMTKVQKDLHKKT